MRTLALVAMAVALTGCQTCQSRSRTATLPCEPGTSLKLKGQCERRGDELHVTVQQPATCPTGCPAQGGQMIPGGTCTAVGMDWAAIPIPVLKVHRIPTAPQWVAAPCAAPCATPTAVAPSACRSCQAAAQAASGPNAQARATPAGSVETQAELEQRAKALEARMDLLIQTLETQSATNSAYGRAAPLPQPARASQDSAMPGIQQTSGAAWQTSSQLEFWPYSPQHPSRIR